MKAGSSSTLQAMTKGSRRVSLKMSRLKLMIKKLQKCAEMLKYARVLVMKDQEFSSKMKGAILPAGTNFREKGQVAASQI